MKDYLGEYPLDALGTRQVPGQITGISGRLTCFVISSKQLGHLHSPPHNSHSWISLSVISAMSNTITASVIQACTVKYDLDQTLQKMTHYVQLAKNRDNAQLVVFPEALSAPVITPIIQTSHR
jgi:hypothetical protein